MNVKLGIGGIREIEFFVQTFQFLYGGEQTTSPSRNIEVLQQLRQSELIPKQDADTWKKHIFLA
ncbi:MAG: hypothetical protein Ct9H300mP21_06150 [Pseudomonadota bacterium]|nr:MAG: hypothetical protein Ct9H300mP21_06150 [Pseudomonadota bacterium]